MLEKTDTLYLPYNGSALLENALLNKGSAFTHEERNHFSLTGLLPATIESITEQAERAYYQFQTFNNPLDKHIYLRNIQDTNETLFYRLLVDHITEMMPIVYTPTVGAACEEFSNIYRRGRGLFLSYSDRGKIADIINHAARPEVKVIVLTDGERILGLGDQGLGGMGIPIGKLALYTACGGINPANTLPVFIDVGTNNPHRLSDPMYMGLRQTRVTDQEYDDFMDEVMQALQTRWPEALIQFEDFAQQNAMPLLQRYKEQACCFNDDIQGTAAVTVGSLIAACRANQLSLSEQRVVFAGAGSAGCGIAEAIVAQMIYEGLSDEQAREQVFMVDQQGLLTDDMQGLKPFQQGLAQRSDAILEWGCYGEVKLIDVIANAKPSILIGVTGVPGLFSESVIREMHDHCPEPIVFPLSNPTARAEATPADIIKWTDGDALVATGSPFTPVLHKLRSYSIAQCNNSYIFPGIGLGVLASGASRITDDMLMESSRALAECSPLAQNGFGPLLPPLEDIQEVSRHIALTVALKAIEQGNAPSMTKEQLIEQIEAEYWRPEYPIYKRAAI